MDVDEVLERAADRVEEPGYWIQDRYTVRDDAGKVVKACAVGAIIEQLETPRSGPWASSREVMDALRAAIDGEAISSWNDVKGRTVEEVAEAMREAARAWRLEHARA